MPDAAAPDPLAFLQLAGHVVRWRLLAELGRSDRTVLQLTRLLDQPQNLVSYHLGKLRRAGLVSARRSTADGRDSWYAVDLARVGAALDATGAALHPGLRPADEGVAEGVRVLFLCTGNSARSQVAEALLEARTDGRVHARSAGSNPKPVHPNTGRVLSELGIEPGERRSTHLDHLVGERFDRVVTLCDRVREVCPEPSGWGEVVHWSTPDPSVEHPDDHEASLPAFRAMAQELDTRVGFLLPTLAPVAA